MKRTDLEHIIRAAGMIAQDDEIIIVGSQAILGQCPDAPSSLLVSIEADIYPKNYPDRADLIDGSIGEESPFQSIFGYYAHGVSPSTAKLPKGWEARLVPICNQNTRNVTGWCLEVHDLAISKYIAGREKDLSFIYDLVKYGLVTKEELLLRLSLLDVENELLGIIRGRILRDFG